MIPAQLIAIGIISEGAITNHRRRMRLGRAIGVSPIVSGLHLGIARRARVQLVFRRDVMDRVITHRQGVIMHMTLPVGEATSSPR